MNWDLYEKYGEHNIDGYYITDHEKWHYYAQRPKLYRKKKRTARAFMLIPIAGIAAMAGLFEEMGLSIF